MLIVDAEVDGRQADLRIANGRVVELAARIDRHPGEETLEARGAALLPGLHDHHLHLVALAKALESVVCGPPQVTDAAELAQVLRGHAASQLGDGAGWLRGIGYHESVAGDIDRHWLDRIVADLPLRIQHRSGRLWILNSCGLARLGAESGSDGRFYDADAWLRERLAGELPSLRQASALLATHGITGITDATPANGMTEYRHFVAEQARGHLLQNVLVMGGAALDGIGACGNIRVGPTKIHLHESDLPDFELLCATIRRSHRAGRPVAFHCVTRVELLFVANALAAAGCRAGDRIEHASVAPPEAVALLAELPIAVVSQPNFILERGDQYLADVDPSDQPWLYRGAGFLAAGVPFAGSTDAPFGVPNPWLAMAAAVDRISRGGIALGPDEALTPEQALALFLGDPLGPGGPPRTVTVGAPADLCLLDRPWAAARPNLAAVRIAATIKDGKRLARP